MNGKQRKYWIYKTEYYCPQCNNTTTYRERRYTKKPKDYNKRNIVIEAYDWCGG